MIKSLHIILLFINVSFCISMDFTRTPARILHEINAVKKPISVFCPSNTEIIITGKDADIIYDINLKKTCKVLNEYEKNIISCSSINQSKTQFALLHNKIITIYKIPEYNIIHAIEGNYLHYLKNKPIFGISDDTVFMLDGAGNIKQEIYNKTYKTYNSSITHEIKLQNNQATYTKLIHHPHKKEITYSTGSELITISYENYKWLENKKNLHHLARQCKYNDNGELIVFSCRDDSLIIHNIISNTQYPLADINYFLHTIYALSFLPNSYILANLNQSFNSPETAWITFWNLKKQKLIMRISLPYVLFNDEDAWKTLCHKHEFMNFFPDGSKLAVTLHGKTIIVETPFEAQYLPEAKNRALFSLCTLGQLEFLPKELRYYITAKTLALHRYSYINC